MIKTNIGLGQRYLKLVSVPEDFCMSVVKLRCIGMLSTTQLLYIVFG